MRISSPSLEFSVLAHRRVEGGDTPSTTPGGGTLLASAGEGKIDGEAPVTEDVEAFATAGSGDGEGGAAVAGKGAGLLRFKIEMDLGLDTRCVEGGVGWGGVAEGGGEGGGRWAMYSHDSSAAIYS